MILVAVLAGGCAGNEALRPAPPQFALPSAVSANDLVITALGQIGSDYRFGGATPAGFDCSGLVHYVHARHGIPVPRTSAEQFASSRPVARKDARAGDLVFFRVRGRIAHVGIYLGDDEFVHAPSTGNPVRVEQLNKHWYRKRLAGFRRLGSDQ